MFIGGFASRYRSVCILPFLRKNFTSKKGIEVVERSLVYLMVGWMPGGGGGVLPEKLGGGVRPASQNPYTIYDQNQRNSLPYL